MKKMKCVSKKTKKIITVVSVISVGLSIGLTTAIISKADSSFATNQISYVNQKLITSETQKNFNESRNNVINDNAAQNEFKKQLNEYKNRTIEFSFDLDNISTLKPHSLVLNNAIVYSKSTFTSKDVNDYVFQKINEYENSYLSDELSLETMLDNANKAGWSNDKIEQVIKQQVTEGLNKQNSENNLVKNISWSLSTKASYTRNETFGGARDKLNDAVIGLSVTAGIATAAAAGFWAAAWWFGITIPWAIAATSLAVGLAANAIGISMMRNRVQAPMDHNYVSRSTSIDNPKSLVMTVNSITSRDLDDLLNLIKLMIDQYGAFEQITKIIEVICLVASFAVPAQSGLQKIINGTLKYLMKSIVGKSFADFFAIWEADLKNRGALPNREI